MSDSMNWKMNFIAVDSMRYLNKFHRKALAGVLLQYSKEILLFTKSLRSAVSRNSLMFLREVFTCTSVDSPLDMKIYVIFTKQLLFKTIRQNAFIVKEAEKSLELIEHHSWQMGIAVLLAEQIFMEAWEIAENAASNLRGFFVYLEKYEGDV